MKEIFGDFVEQGPSEEYLIVHFSSTSVPIQQRWRNTGLSADFLAEYWSTFFPAGEVSRRKRLEITGAIRYIANELLENLMKFSYDQVNYPVSLELYLYQDKFRFYAGNAVDPQFVEPFQARIQELLTGDIDALYMQQLKKNSVDSGMLKSNLGLLTMIHDYNVRMAWRFETLMHQGSDTIVLTTMVELEV